MISRACGNPVKDTHLNWSLKQNWCYHIYPKCSVHVVSTQIKLLMKDMSGQVYTIVITSMLHSALSD